MRRLEVFMSCESFQLLGAGWLCKLRLLQNKSTKNVCGGIKKNITYTRRWNLQMRSRFTIWIKVKGLKVLQLHTWFSPANTHLWIPGRVCLVDMCGLFSLSAELFMLLTPQWSTPSTWASNISVEIKKKGVGCRKVGQGGVDPEGIRGVLKPLQYVAQWPSGQWKLRSWKLITLSSAV